uniref:EamA domain-containing protein n=2 Tax=Triticinae TaxID=1648030 RepID=I3NM20_WHEAT|nr:EamA domain-containing protein [Triticum aestivum]ADP02200.1 DUF6 domain-containing protein [Aegilops tauschii]
MASSLAPASCALPLHPRVATAAAAAAGPSCRVLLAFTAPRSAASVRRAGILAPLRCSPLEDPGATGREEGGKEKGGVSKRVHGRPMWRRILFASKKTRSIMILNALTVIYASDIPVLKEVEALTEPAVFNMVRFVIAAIPFIPFVIRAFGDRRTRNGGLELGVWVSLAYLAQAIGLITSEAGRASFIAAFTVIVVPLIDGIFGASIPMLTWFGAIVSVIGVGLLECGGSPPCVGDVLNFLSAVFFGIHMLRTEQISRSTDKKKFMALLSFEMPSLRSTIPALNHGRLMVAMAHVSATETAIVYGLEPVWGATFAWFLLGERWDNAAWIGAALVLCGSLTVQLFGSAPEKSQKVESRSGNTFESPLKRQERLSLSAIPVDSRKNIGSQLERKDKTL